MTHGKSRTRYFVTFPGQPELEVSFEDWCRAERAAGFRGPEGHAATGGFTGHGISGRIEFGLIADSIIPGAPTESRSGELELEEYVAANLADFRSRPGVGEGKCADCGSDHCLYDDEAGESFCPACAWGAS